RCSANRCTRRTPWCPSEAYPRLVETPARRIGYPVDTAQCSNRGARQREQPAPIGCSLPRTHPGDCTTRHISDDVGQTHSRQRLKRVPEEGKPRPVSPRVFALFVHGDLVTITLQTTGRYKTGDTGTNHCNTHWP